MDFLEVLRARIQARLDERSAVDAELDAITNAAEVEGRANLTEPEEARWAELRESLDTIDADVTQLRARVAEVEDVRARRTAASDAAAAVDAIAPAATAPRAASAAVANVRVGHEPRTYEGQPGAYLRDLVRAEMLGRSDSRERLVRHAQEMDVEARALGRDTDIELGYFVPPLYAISDYAELARAGRPFADSLMPADLPAGVDSVKVPRITTGTKMRVQAGDKAAVTTQDIVTAETTAELVTVAGYVDVAVQAIDQAPIDTQALLFADLEADYATQFDTLLWSGAGPGSDEPLGVLTLGDTNSTSWGDTSPTVAELYPKIGETISKVHSNRLLPAQVIWMHPRRWAWITSAIAEDGRPLAGFSQTMPQNVAAYVEAITPENRAGTMQGLPVLLDANLPVNLGSSTNEDIIVVARTTDARLWEGSPRMNVRRVDEEGSNKLLVRLELYRYSIFLPGRQPKSWSKLGGAGLVTPTF